MAYIGRQQDGFGVRSRFIYTATGGQTTFNTDDSGNALSYADSAYVDVYLNGVLLDPADYTATSLTSIVLGSGATASDILEVIVYDVFSVFSGTFTNGITANSVISPLVDVADASGTNTAGTALSIQGGAGTGSGAAGKILLKTAPAGSSGSSVNSHATMLAVGGSGVGIGHDSPTAELHIKGDTTDDQVIIENTNAGAANAPDLTLFRNSASPADDDVLGIIKFDGKNDAAETTEYASIQAKADDVSDGTEDGIIIFKNIVAGTLAERMRIDGSDVAIGTNTPVSLLHVHEASTEDAEIHMTNSSSGSTASDGMTIFANEGSAGILYRENNAFRIFTNGAEVARFLADGTFLVGKTASDFDGGIFEAGSGGTFVSRTGSPFNVNRNSSDGKLTGFSKDGTEVGVINAKGGDLNIGTGDTGLRFNDNQNALQPFNTSTNAAINNTITLGTSGAKFNEIFCGNATINTSDETEKQQIASLTSAEIAAATAISKLFKTYKWNSAVASKGDNARIHTGVIAQQVRTALEAEGLDATKYSFWCSDTWWEKEIEVPAVEAVEARGAVIDDDKNIVAEAVDAVEAQDAYTYVEQYYTADEAPEGATEKTLLGIRYPELLAFVGAATEQRLTSIEARLTALEA
tara:strand:- start:387 stop:2294 length:1908 start_codon:yes stop_codon:yes gene_type:complete